jgi:hypothetical protein
LGWFSWVCQLRQELQGYLGTHKGRFSCSEMFWSILGCLWLCEHGIVYKYAWLCACACASEGVWWRVWAFVSVCNAVQECGGMCVMRCLWVTAWVCLQARYWASTSVAALRYLGPSRGGWGEGRGLDICWEDPGLLPRCAIETRAHSCPVSLHVQCLGHQCIEECWAPEKEPTENKMWKVGKVV